tara:strand:- start:255 stop:452 length:198 start_codon:yes stop_codon:yes gene_type:complete
VAVSEEGGGEGGRGVEGLSEEEVAVIEGGGVDCYEEVVGAWGGVWDVFDLEAGDVISCQYCTAFL